MPIANKAASPTQNTASTVGLDSVLLFWVFSNRTVSGRWSSDRRCSPSAAVVSSFPSFFFEKEKKMNVNNYSYNLLIWMKLLAAITVAWEKSGQIKTQVVLVAHRCPATEKHGPTGSERWALRWSVLAQERRLQTRKKKTNKDFEFCSISSGKNAFETEFQRSNDRFFRLWIFSRKKGIEFSWFLHSLWVNKCYWRHTWDDLINQSSPNISKVSLSTCDLHRALT